MRKIIERGALLVMVAVVLFELVLGLMRPEQAGELIFTFVAIGGMFGVVALVGGAVCKTIEGRSAARARRMRR